MQGHQDLAQVQSAVSGSTEAWRDLVTDYTGLALSVAHRHLHDHDLARDVVADVFECLFRGKLEQFDGRSSFGTWLVLIVRNAAVDRLRRERGRVRLPAPILRRPATDQRVFELFFVQGWPSKAVYGRMQSEGARLDYEDFLSLLSDMDGQLDHRARRRLRFDRQAHRLGVPSGRWLEYVDHVRYEASSRTVEIEPEAESHTDERDHLLSRMRAELARLDEQERQALAMRFGRNLSARQIASEMKLKNQRQAYTVVERALRKLRKAFGVADGVSAGRLVLGLEAKS